MFNTFPLLLIICISTWAESAAPVDVPSPFTSLAATAIRETVELKYAWNPAGDKFAYVHAQALWMVDLVTGKKSSLGPVTGDHCDLMWSPSRVSLLWACPNFLISVASNSGHAKRLLASPSPLAEVKYSPNGETITFVRDNNLWQMPSAGGSARPLTTAGDQTHWLGLLDPVFAHEFRASSAYWWAPDSSAIAFLETDASRSGTYPHPGKPLPALELKLLTLANGKESSIAVGSAETPYLRGVAWLPDSRKIAYQVLNRLQNQSQLNIFDLPSGSVRHVLIAKDAYWINPPWAPVFLPNAEQFLMTSERTGYRRLYLYNLTGELVRDLTPDKFEVSGEPTLDATGKWTYFPALTGSMLELHFYRVGIEGHPLQQITKVPGWHEISLNPAATAFADSVSTADSPESTSLRRMDGSELAQITTVPPESAPKAEFTQIKTHDNVPLPAMLWKPLDFDPQKRYPVIVFTFSGPEGHVVKNAWGQWQNVWNRFMATKGYLVVAVDVRGSGGYGHYFEDYIHYRLGAEEIADLREVYSYLTRVPFVDSKQIGIWGYAYGAHLVVHALLEFPDGFKAGFADSPITDWSLYNAYFSERYLGLPGHRITEYDDSSALGNAKRMRGRLLVAASPADPFIHPDQVSALQAALDKVKKPLETAFFPNADYHQEAPSLADLYQRMTQFFDASLRAW